MSRDQSSPIVVGHLTILRRHSDQDTRGQRAHGVYVIVTLPTYYNPNRFYLRWYSTPYVVERWIHTRLAVPGVSISLKGS